MNFNPIKTVFSRLGWKVIFTALVTLAGAYIYVVDYLPARQLEVTMSSQLASVFAAAPQVFNLGSRSKSADCQVVGPLPDKECSPGAVFDGVTKKTICVSGYTKTVRSVSTSTRKKVFAEYGIAWPQPFGSYEVDHIIPLSLGGNNDIANLFPEAATPYPGFKEKDVVENYLHEHVCSGEIDLTAAQLQIANDWLAVYNNLSESTIRYYKNKYRNWAGSN